MKILINDKLAPMAGIQLFILCMLVNILSPIHAVESTKLNDVIKANGTGVINLFTPFHSKRIVNGEILEQFRQDNNGELVFAVDVNEAADGSEKSSSQGVTIEMAEIILIINGVEHRYTEYNTRSTSILAKKGSTQRSLYSTLLGDSGSNRISPSSDSDLTGSSFDSTLNFPIPDDISQTTSATLMITFLDTNVGLGDPEAFYDFSNGYEDIAIISAVDAAYLDQLSPGKDEAPLVLPESTVASPEGGTIYYPSQTGYYVVAYEDFYPSPGDYDFNDLVVGYRIAANMDSNGNLLNVSGEGYLIARGAGYNHDWHLRIGLSSPVTGSASVSLYNPGEVNIADGYPLSHSINGDISLPIFTNLRNTWVDSPYEGVNTLPEQSVIQGHRFTFSTALDSSIPLADMESAPFDPFLYVRDTRYEIHLKNQAPVLDNSVNIANGHTDFTDDRNYPFAMIFPDEWQIPLERTDLGEAYPQFLEFVLSEGANNVQWYNSPASGKVKNLPASIWKW